MLIEGIVDCLFTKTYVWGRQRVYNHAAWWVALIDCTLLHLRQTRILLSGVLFPDPGYRPMDTH